MLTIGEKLADSRQRHGLSIEDVAYETHIPPTTILNIESDDFSGFPSVAYARSFIRKYADYLGIDISPAMRTLESGVSRLGENPLMEEMKKTIRKDRRFRLERRPKAVRRKLDARRRAPLLLNAMIFVIIGALVIFYFLGFNASSPEEAKSEITKGLQKANPFSEEEMAAPTIVQDETDAQAQESDGLNIPENPLAADSVAASTRPSLRPARLDAEEISLAESDPPLETPSGTPVAQPIAPPSPGTSPPIVTEDEPTIEKPRVDWDVDQSEPRPLAKDTVAVKPKTESDSETIDTPAARTTPELEMEAQFDPVSPIQSSDLPALRQALEEPTAVLRPAGTDPARKEEQEEARPGTVQIERPALRVGFVASGAC